MLGNCKTLKERWGGVTDIIDRWLDSRQDMLLAFCDLTTSENSEIASAAYGSQLKNFCELLMDYISAGHFEVFQQLMEEGRAFGDDKAIIESSDLLNQVHESTQKTLDFNDTYLATNNLDSITLDLTKLGVILAERFEAEDRMIEVLHTAHQDLLSA